jgi:hypothetical protein
MTGMTVANARRRSRVPAWLLGLAATLAPATAHALDAEVTSDSAAQFYDVRSPAASALGDVTVLERRRLTTTLGLGLYNLMDAPQGDPKAPDLSFRARIRYDADYGVASAETDPTNPANFPVFVPGLNQQLVDLMYGYVEGRRFAGGWLGFKLGRQYVTDVLGWWAFDGAEASVTTPYYLKAEVYGGLEERGGMPLSTPRFEAEGVWAGSRSGFPSSLYTPFQPARLAPAYAVALESTGVTWIHGRLTYRRVYNTGSSNTSEFANGTPTLYDASRISSDRLGYAMDASLSNLGGVKAGIVYDFYRGDVTSIYGSIDAYLSSRITVSADYDYYVPSFDGDSIWNFFAGEPMNDVGLRANVDFNDQLSVAGGAHVRVYDVQTAAFTYPASCNNVPCTASPFYDAAATYFPTNGHPFDEGADLRARWRTNETNLGLRFSGAWGDEGDRVGADLSGEHVFESRYVASARTGVWAWDDKLREDRSSTTFNYVLGLGYLFAPRSRGSVEWEHDFSGLVGQRFRLMFLLTLAAVK